MTTILATSAAYEAQSTSTNEQISAHVSTAQDHLNPVTTFLRDLWEKLLVWETRREQRRQLAEMEQHMLQDMGISAAQASREIAKPAWKA